MPRRDAGRRHGDRGSTGWVRSSPCRAGATAGHPVAHQIEPLDGHGERDAGEDGEPPGLLQEQLALLQQEAPARMRDRKTTRLNSSHQIISYAFFFLEKKK